MDAKDKHEKRANAASDSDNLLAGAQRNEPTVGEEVTLRWNGVPPLPKWLSGAKAIVLEVKRKRVVVQPKIAVKPYTVRKEHIWEYHSSLRNERE